MLFHKCTPQRAYKMIRRNSIRLVADHYIWLLVILLLVIASLTLPRFFTIVNFLNIFYHTSAIGMMILGMSFCLLVGRMDLSLESTFAIAPTIGVLMVYQWAPVLPGWSAVPIALAVGAAIGFINAMLVIRLNINSFLATLAMLIILRGLLVYILPQGLWEIPELISFLGSAQFYIGDIRFPVTILIFVFLFLLAGFIVSNTAFGKDMMAVGANPTAAFIAGINVERIYIIVFVIAGACAAFGGVLLSGRIGSILNGMGEGDILLVFAGTVLGGISLNGGKGRISNALGGALLLTTISTILNYGGFSPFLVRAFQGFILLAAMIVSAQGHLLARLLPAPGQDDSTRTGVTTQPEGK